MILLESGCRWVWWGRTEVSGVTQVLIRTPFKSMSKALQIRKAAPDFKGEKSCVTASDSSLRGENCR